jgi:hypothetical protein
LHDGFFLFFNIDENGEAKKKFEDAGKIARQKIMPMQYTMKTIESRIVSMRWMVENLYLYFIPFHHDLDMLDIQINQQKKLIKGRKSILNRDAILWDDTIFDKVHFIAPLIKHKVPNFYRNYNAIISMREQNNT